MCAVLAWMIGKDASSLGNLLTGIAALGALVVAALQLNSWKEQQHQQKISTAAAKCMQATIKMLKAIEDITYPLYMVSKRLAEQDAEKTRGQIVLERLNSRMPFVRDDVANFDNALVEAEVYLSDSVVKDMEQLRELWVEAILSIQNHAEMLDEKNPDKDERKKAYDGIWGKEVREKRKDVGAQLKATLKKIIHLEKDVFLRT